MEAVSDVEEEEDSDLDEMDSVSLHSAPRPSIRPFFGHAASSEETLSVVRFSSHFLCSQFFILVYVSIVGSSTYTLERAFSLIV